MGSQRHSPCPRSNDGSRVRVRATRHWEVPPSRTLLVVPGVPLPSQTRTMASRGSIAHGCWGRDTGHFSFLLCAPHGCLICRVSSCVRALSLRPASGSPRPHGAARAGSGARAGRGPRAAYPTQHGCSSFSRGPESCPNVGRRLPAREQFAFYIFQQMFLQKKGVLGQKHSVFNSEFFKQHADSLEFHGDVPSTVARGRDGELSLEPGDRVTESL